MKKVVTEWYWLMLALIIVLACGCAKRFYSQFVPSPKQMRKGETYYVKNDQKCPGEVRVVVACHCGGDGSNHTPSKELPDYCMPCPKEETCP